MLCLVAGRSDPGCPGAVGRAASATATATGGSGAEGPRRSSHRGGRAEVSGRAAKEGSRIMGGTGSRIARCQPQSDSVAIVRCCPWRRRRYGRRMRRRRPSWSVRPVAHNVDLQGERSSPIGGRMTMTRPANQATARSRNPIEVVAFSAGRTSTHASRLATSTQTRPLRTECSSCGDQDRDRSRHEAARARDEGVSAGDEHGPSSDRRSGATVGRCHARSLGRSRALPNNAIRLAS